jgi:AraC-like DNA-binding protein
MKATKQPFSGHQFYLDKDFQILSYYDTNKDRIYRHSHDFYELYILISGHVKYFTAGNSFYLAPGDFLFINRYQEHFPDVLDFSKPYERMALQVSPKALEELSDDSIDLAAIFSGNEFKVYHYPPLLRNKIDSYLNQLMDLASAPDAYGAHILGRSILSALFVLFNQYINTPSVYSFDKSNKDIQLVSIAENYIREHIQEKITVEDISNHFFMNRYYFMHQFKEISGQSFYQFVQEIRLKTYLELQQNGYPVMKAAQQCGFKDYPNFYRLFKKKFGCPPAEYDIKKEM